MYFVKKRIEVSASHKLNLSYESKCENLHGHNWIIDIYMRSEELNKDGMVMDFTHIQNEIKDKLDHKNLNDVLSFNTTAEKNCMKNEFNLDTINLFINECEERHLKLITYKMLHMKFHPKYVIPFQRREQI